MKKIPLARPSFDAADEQAVLETLRSGWVGSGPKVALFEARLASGSIRVHTLGRMASALGRIDAARQREPHSTGRGICRAHAILGTGRP